MIPDVIERPTRELVPPSAGRPLDSPWTPVRVGLLVGTGAFVLVWVTMARLTGSVSLFLSPDGGHYLTDAAALTGTGIRELTHPPAFPALVAASRGIVSPVGQVQLALGAGLWLLVVALYLLCRQFAGIPASIAGAGIGASFPAIGELIAWNGGATLLATAFLVLALASTEHWLRTGRPSAALATGAAAAAALLAHPFVAAVAFFCTLVRWFVELVYNARPRRVHLRGGPFSVAQVALVAVPVILALPFTVRYYTSVEADAGVHFGFPRLGEVWDTLTWGLREQGVLLLLFVVFLVAMLAGGRASASLAAALGAVYLVVSSATRADPSYRTRVAYLLPIIGAVGAALLWKRVVPPIVAWLAPGSRHRPLLLVAGSLTAVTIFASLGYLPRLPRAAAFYQRLDPVDVTALQTLRGAPGLVATSWNQNAYGNGISNSWYVEGVAARRAAGPTDPALSTIAREQQDGAAMQQFFSGVAGVQNGGLQLAVGPPGSFSAPGVQAMIDGMYRPILYINDQVSAYPTPLGRSGESFGDLAANAEVEHTVSVRGVSGRYRVSTSSAPVATMHASLRGGQVVFEYRWTGRATKQRLTVRLFPAYGILWRDLRATPQELRFVADPFALTGVTTAGKRGQDVTLRGEGGTRLRYLQREPQFSLQSVEMTAGKDGRARFVLSAPGAPTAHGNRAYDQASIARRLDVTDVVLWKDTGWEPRFSDPACFAQTEETNRLLVYRMRLGCRAKTGAEARTISSDARG